MLYSGYLPKADKIFFPKVSVYWSKSHKHKLSKVDTYLKQTKILIPKVSALDRFHCVSVNEYPDSSSMSSLIRLLITAPDNSRLTMLFVFYRGDSVFTQ